MIIIYSSDFIGVETVTPVEFKILGGQYPFFETVKRLSEAFFYPLMLPSNYEQAHVVKACYLQGSYTNDLIWVIRNYLKNRSVNESPFHTNIMKAHKSGGDLKTKRFDLCCGVVDYFNLSQTAINLWESIEIEEKYDWWIMAFENKTKRHYENMYRDELKSLRKWTNPYHRSSKISYLIDLAINISKPQKIIKNEELAYNRKKFINECWLPYLDVFAKYIKDLDEGLYKCKFVTIPVINSHLKMQLGGRRTQTIHSPRKLNLSNRGIKPKSQSNLLPEN